MSQSGAGDVISVPISSSLRAWLDDARHYQIAALGILLVFNITALDLSAHVLPSVLAITSSLATQALCSRIWRLPRVDLRSPLITGFSLSLLVRADEPWVYAAAGVIAISSKFLLRLDGKHLWNPAGLAIVALLFGTNHVWISPGQWGANVWFAALLTFLAIMVLQAARRADISLFFLGAHAALLFARALWLGDPLAIPIHQLESGSLLLFTFFMISDPRTTPDARIGRLVLALAVALLAYWLAFFMQMRPALYVALIALSPLTPVLDRLFPAERFHWIRFPNLEQPNEPSRNSPPQDDHRLRRHRGTARSAGGTRRCLLRLLCRQGRQQALQQSVQSGAELEQRQDRRHHGE